MPSGSVRLLVVLLVGIAARVVVFGGGGHGVARVVLVSVGAVFLVGSVGGLFLPCCIRLLCIVLRFHCGKCSFVHVLRTALRIGAGRGIG